MLADQLVDWGCWLCSKINEQWQHRSATRSSEDIAIDSCRRDTRLRHWLTLRITEPAAATGAEQSSSHSASGCLSSTFICRRWELREIERHYRQLARQRRRRQRCNNSEIELKSSTVAWRVATWHGDISVSVTNCTLYFSSSPISSDYENKHKCLKCPFITDELWHGHGLLWLYLNF